MQTDQLIIQKVKNREHYERCYKLPGVKFSQYVFLRIVEWLMVKMTTP